MNAAPMPPLAALLRHLADAPPDWQAPVEVGRSAGVRISALLSDTLIELGDPPLDDAEAKRFSPSNAAALPWLQLLLASLWLLHESGLQSALQTRWSGAMRSRLLDFLAGNLGPRSAYLSAERALTSAEGREELARQLLAALGLRPGDEDEGSFAYRLQARDSVGQAELVERARAAEERARKLREAMARKAAEEAAMKYNRE